MARPVTARRAFTLIELMIVVIIIGVLAAMAIPRLTGRSEQARVNAAEADVKGNIPTALKLFELDNGRFPSTAEGIAALNEQPPNAPRWKGPYLDSQAADPWGAPYQYAYPGAKNKGSFDLWSKGADGQSGTDDDIGNWKRG